MATYNNQHWLLSHIRNSFISTDDTGMCEAVMLSEDLPSRYIQNHTKLQSFRSTSEQQEVTTPNTRPPEEFLYYPGLQEQEDEDDVLNQSYDIQMDQEIGLHRQRSNTDQELETMDLARRKASKIKNIKCEDPVKATQLQHPELTQHLFIRNQDFTKKENVSSRLSEQLIKCPKQPQNKFLEYARFDGTAQTGIPTRTIKIFLTMLPERQRNYPLQICVTLTAKIQDFIGLICYKTSIMYPDVQLQSVRHYGLYITEEDGEVDMDLPALDIREPCSKFGFSHLALAERRLDSITSTTSSRYEDRTLSITSESELNKIEAESRALAHQHDEDMARMLGHTSMMEAPLYQSYRVYILSKARFKTEIQLGVSGEKIEIDPIQQKNNRFWTRQKASNHSMESIALCEIIETKGDRKIFRIVYSPKMGHIHHQRMLQHQHSMDAYLLAAATASSSSSSANTAAASSAIHHHHLTSSPLQSSASFKHYDFEAESKTADEIVKKINNILEVRISASRREYLATKEKKKLMSGKKVHLSTSK